MVKDKRIIVFGGNRVAHETVAFLKTLGHSDVSLRASGVDVVGRFDVGILSFDLVTCNTGRPNAEIIRKTLSRFATQCENFYIRANMAPGDLGFLNQKKFQVQRLFFWPYMGSGKIPLLSVSPRVPDKHIAMHRELFGENFIHAPLKTVEAAFYMHQSYLFIEKVMQMTFENIYKAADSPFSEVLRLVASQDDAMCARFLDMQDVKELRRDFSVLLHGVNRRELKEAAFFEVTDSLFDLYTKK